jgi:hypothetical protein
VEHTLLGSGQGATGIHHGVNGNLVGVVAQLGPLTDNGGPTWTHALLAGSPAIDAGANPDGLAGDQRGFGPRTVNGVADIGAFELAATPSLPPPSRPPSHGVKTRIVVVNGRRRLQVLDAATGKLRFQFPPWGSAFKGPWAVQTRDVNRDSFQDVVVWAGLGGERRGWVFDGRNGRLLRILRVPNDLVWTLVGVGPGGQVVIVRNGFVWRVVGA